MSNARNVRLRELLHSGKILVAPCCHDALSASLIEQSGFEATFVSGAAATNTSIGISDVGLLSYGEYRGIFQNILSDLPSLFLWTLTPVTAACCRFMRMVEEYEAMGISGIQLEDPSISKTLCCFLASASSPPKRCASGFKRRAAPAGTPTS